MQRGSMLIDYCCRLRAAVAVRALEVEGGDAIFAEGALECGPAIHRLGCVISHIFMVVLLTVWIFGAIGARPSSRKRLSIARLVKRVHFSFDATGDRLMQSAGRWAESSPPPYDTETLLRVGDHVEGGAGDAK
jgi:hypothetical protein